MNYTALMQNFPDLRGDPVTSMWTQEKYQYLRGRYGEGPEVAAELRAYCAELRKEKADMIAESRLIAEQNANQGKPGPSERMKV